MPAGLLRTGLLGISTQLTCLVVAVSPALLSLAGTRVAPASATHILVGGLVASRFGLWTFDLCVTQLLQEWVLTQALGKSRVSVTRKRKFNLPGLHVDIACCASHHALDMLPCGP